MARARAAGRFSTSTGPSWAWLANRPRCRKKDNEKNVQMIWRLARPSCSILAMLSTTTSKARRPATRNAAATPPPATPHMPKRNRPRQAARRADGLRRGHLRVEAVRLALGQLLSPGAGQTCRGSAHEAQGGAQVPIRKAALRRAATRRCREQPIPRGRRRAERRHAQNLHRPRRLRRLDPRTGRLGPQHRRLMLSSSWRSTCPTRRARFPTSSRSIA